MWLKVLLIAECQKDIIYQQTNYDCTLILFPKANIGRMDLDTTRGKYGYQKIIGQFQAQEIDVLVGTQMLSKGLDFDNIS